MTKENEIQNLEEQAQLYLLGECSTEIMEKFENIESTHKDSLSSEQDKEIKSIIEKLRFVDQMFSNSIETSFPIPNELSSQIDRSFSENFFLDKADLSSTKFFLLDAIKKLNPFSFIGGGLAATLGMIAVLQFQPSLIMMGNLENEDFNVLRGVEVNTNQLSENFIQHPEVPYLEYSQNNFDFFGPLAYQFPVFENDVAIGTIKSGAKVLLDQSFSIRLLAIENVQVQIEYISPEGGSETILKKLYLDKGREYKTNPIFRFSLPVGLDNIRLIINDTEKIIEFDVIDKNGG